MSASSERSLQGRGHHDAETFRNNHAYRAPDADGQRHARQRADRHHTVHGRNRVPRFERGDEGGAFRNTDVDLESTTDTGGGCHVGWVDPGDLVVDGSTAGIVGNFNWIRIR